MGKSTYIHYWLFTSRGWDSLSILLTHIPWIRAVHWLFWSTSSRWESQLLTHIPWIRAVHWLFWSTSSRWESQLIILTDSKMWDGFPPWTACLFSTDQWHYFFVWHINSKVWDGFLPWTACLFSTDQWHYFFVWHTDSKVWDGFPPSNSPSYIYIHCQALQQHSKHGWGKCTLAPQPPPCQWQTVHVQEYTGQAVQVCVCVCTQYMYTYNRYKFWVPFWQACNTLQYT